jgi:hypothetical protein
MCEEAKLVIAGRPMCIFVAGQTEGQVLILLYLSFFFPFFLEHCQCLKIKLPLDPGPHRLWLLFLASGNLLACSLKLISSTVSIK